MTNYDNWQAPPYFYFWKRLWVWPCFLLLHDCVRRVAPLDECGRAKAKNTAIPARSTYSRVEEVFLYPPTYNTNCYVIGASQNKRFFTRYFTRRPWCLMGVAAEVGLKIVATWATGGCCKLLPGVFFHGLMT